MVSSRQNNSSSMGLARKLWSVPDYYATQILHQRCAGAHPLSHEPDHNSSAQEQREIIANGELLMRYSSQSGSIHDFSDKQKDFFGGL